LVTLDDGTLLEGIADLVFRAPGNDPAPHWTVVDFKTDADLTPHLAEYRAQVALYARALHASTRASVSGVILWI
ncbi:MAG TPA: PD-(D/E)XK nuclease family protein, partial [Candidatus Binataceae bacterium]|nr:PD-(D/E)XK nuclease family protein [Candidatus Binataceae bacterium]